MCVKYAGLPKGIFSCRSVRIDSITILISFMSLISQMYKVIADLTSGVPYVICLACIVVICVFVVSYVYLLHLMCVCCTLCVFVVLYVYLLYLMCICCTLCVFVVLCVYCCSYFRCRTAG